MKEVMTLEGYGVKLHRLTEDKIELVRHWRNQPKIQQYMEYREYITKEQQSAWFKSIDNDNNFYFIIEYEGKEIGLINIKNVDYEKSEAEPGIFIWDDDYLNTDATFRASFCMGDFINEVIKIEHLCIHVMRDNKRAIAYNKAMGYELAEGQDNEINQKYIKNKEKGKRFREKVIKYLLQ